MSAKYNKWEKFYNQLSTVFYGVIAFTIIPFGWAFLETQKEFPDPPILEGQTALIVKWGLLIASLSVMLTSHYYSSNLLVKARQMPGIEPRLKAYLAEKLKDFMLLELASVLAFLGLYLLKDQVFSLVYVAVLLLFSIKRPGYDKILRELDLKDADVRKWISEEEK